MGGYSVLHDVMMAAAAPFWLDPSADRVSHAIRESTGLEVRDWVVWVEAQLYEVLVEASRLSAPLVSENEPSISDDIVFCSMRSVAVQTDWSINCRFDDVSPTAERDSLPPRISGAAWLSGNSQSPAGDARGEGSRQT